MAMRLKLPSNIAAPAIIADVSIYRGSIWAGWSMRKLRPNTPALPITLQRSDDGANKAFGFNGAGWLDTDAIAAWAGSGSAKLVRWKGLGPALDRAKNMGSIYTAGALEVEGGRPTLRLPGASSGYLSGIKAWSGAGLTVFAVCRLNTGVLVNSTHMLFRIGDAPGATHNAGVGMYLRAPVIGAAGNADGDAYAFVRGRDATGGTGKYITQGAGIASGLLAQHAVAIDDSASVWKRNGVALPARSAVAGTPIAMTRPVINIGRTVSVSSTSSMIGALSELIIYNERLGDSQIADITAHQRELFGI